MKNLDLYSLIAKRDNWINPSLENISAVCQKLGNPHLDYPVIQIGGTNGKTSVTTYISRILENEGLKVGKYTSPHLESFTERISIDSQNIADEELVFLINEVMSISSESEKLSGFEILTACAFKYFNERKIDVAILEVGMGGRWDATSITCPSVAAITNVSLDHTEILGGTKEKIALEKIEIVKEGVPLFTTETDPAILNIFKEHCSKKKSDIFVIDESDIPDRFYDSNIAWHRKNMSLAIAVAREFLKKEIKLSNLNIIKEQSMVQGRFETISRVPHIIVDGAHNPAAAYELDQALKQLYGDKKITFILGILADKDVEGIVGQFMSSASKIIVTENQNERSLAAEALFDYVKKSGKEAIILKSLKNALQYAVSNWTKGELICVTGSLYTVGSAKSYLREILRAVKTDRVE